MIFLHLYTEIVDLFPNKKILKNVFGLNAEERRTAQNGHRHKMGKEK
jgi:hypothetical protein